MRKLFVLSVLALAVTFALPAYASDAGVAAEATEAAVEAVKLPAPVPDSSEISGLLTDLVKNVQDGNWRMAVSAALFLLMFGLRLLKLPFLQGDRGGAISVMVLALAGAFATALASGAPITLSLVGGAVGVAFTAVGGFTWVKRVWKPKDKKPAES
jgi:hypothetical protein